MFRALWVLVLWVVLPAGHVAAKDPLNPPWLRGKSAPSDLTISLVIVGPGDSLNEHFGHAAIEVEDRKRKVAWLYNFGMFDDDDLFVVRFLRGRLTFRLGLQPARAVYRWYADHDRDLSILELDLPPERAAEMAHDLATLALPENRNYLYHHFEDNCATRIVDALDRVTGGAFKPSLEGSGRLTFRQHVQRFTARSPALDWLLTFAGNDTIDRPISRRAELFLPAELTHAVERFRYSVDGVERPLVRTRRVLHRARVERRVFDTPPPRWPYTLALGVLLATPIAVSGRLYARRATRARRLSVGLLAALVGLSFGTLGLALTLMALFTEHWFTYWNENLFFANPLTLLLLPLGVGVMLSASWADRALPRLWVALAGLCALGLLLKALPQFDQDNAPVWSLLLPITLAGCSLWSRKRAVESRGPADAAPSAP